MRCHILTLFLVALSAVGTVVTGDTEHGDVAIGVDSDLVVDEDTLQVQEETADDAVPAQEVDPRLTAEVMEKIISKMSGKCQTQVRGSIMDPSKISDRCRNEVARRVQRYLKRLEEEEKGETVEKEKKQTKKHKRSSRTSKKKSRAQREAAKAEVEYQKTLQTILAFVATLTAIAVGAIFFINRKLKAAGMYFPDPEAKASCCN
ncbi:hypothetical protein CCR75_001193 [Bremia lactucae]|uniref:RxLR effector protein n=1 Tax=Bremia lactucae TaxID=4779 RepID=A0A976FQW3_BRELC|nr:hypothetical protein CCR75_001193 [Bremia lactucae]